MAPKSKKPAGKQTRSAIADVVAREYTIHLHKRVSRRFLLYTALEDDADSNALKALLEIFSSTEWRSTVLFRFSDSIGPPSLTVSLSATLYEQNRWRLQTDSEEKQMGYDSMFRKEILEPMKPSRPLSRSNTCWGSTFRSLHFLVASH